jgi:putative FmdB family regulatory protein
MMMPNYEYRCNHCKKRFEIFMKYEDYGKTIVQCPHCKNQDVNRRIGRIRFAKSEESRLENLSDVNNLEGLEDDPRALGKMMRKMSSEMGEDLGPEFNEVVGRLEKGQNPEDIEKELPDLGSPADDMGTGSDGLDDF